MCRFLESMSRIPRSQSLKMDYTTLIPAIPNKLIQLLVGGELKRSFTDIFTTHLIFLGHYLILLYMAHLGLEH